jgi:type II secretory pathway pseudopilin PulG
MIRPARRRDRGFTLAEVAIVFAIVALLIGGTVLTLAAQTEARELTDTQRALDAARDALLGFAVANGRLPCPAGAASGGQELPAGGGACTITLNPAGPLTQPGFLPAVTLGLSGTNPNGLLPDAWGNPIRYAVTRANGNAFTTTNGLKNLGFMSLTPDLVVCVDLPGGPVDPTCGANRVAVNVAVVVYSPGKSFLQSGPLGPDEQENLNQAVPVNRNPVFVTHEPRPNFDDLVITLSPNILYNRMIAAGAI